MVATGLFTSAANADPKQYTGLVAVGSDTTQDVMDAMTGFSNGTFYTPLNSGAATDYRVVNSFNAVGSTCITTKINGPTFNRSNGSSQGRRALSRAFDGAAAGYGTAACGGLTDVTGFVDFARSSSGPSSGDTGTDLVYVPFARDALSFAYYRACAPACGSAVDTLTRAELVALFTNGRQTIDGVEILPCGIQLGSGTFKSWNSSLGINDATEDLATAECNALLAEGRAQEHDGNDLKDRGIAAAADATINNPDIQVVIGFSASQWIAQRNGVSPLRTPNDANQGVYLGNIDDDGNGNNIGNPIVGTQSGTGPFSPNVSFYTNATFGRDVYNVFPSGIINSLFGNQDIKDIFKGSGSAICNAPFSDTVEDFGFLSPANCGDTTLTGSFLTGNL